MKWHDRKFFCLFHSPNKTETDPPQTRHLQWDTNQGIHVVAHAA